MGNFTPRSREEHERTRGRLTSDPWSFRVLGAAIKVHRALGPGLLESAYQSALAAELKAVEALLPIHAAQLLTYLRLGGFRTGLLLNFNVASLRQGIIRRVL